MTKLRILFKYSLSNLIKYVLHWAFGTNAVQPQTVPMITHADVYAPFITYKIVTADVFLHFSVIMYFGLFEIRKTKENSEFCT